MNRLQQTIRQVRRRQVLAAAANRGGTGLAAGLLVAVVLLVALRVTGTSPPLAVLLAPAVLGMALGLGWAMATPPTSRRIAIDLDHGLGLRDRLGTAVALDERPRRRDDPAFAALVRVDAERIAGRVDPRRVSHVQAGRNWAVAAVIAGLGGAAYAWVPTIHPAASPDETPPATATVDPEAERLAVEIDEALSEVADLPDQDEVQDDVDALRELARQLEESPGAPGDVETQRAESAARMTEVADTLTRDAERTLDARRELTQRFRGLPSPDAPLTTSELRDALQRGDFGEAAEQIERMLDEGPDLDATEREAAREDLRDLARAVEAAGQPSSPDARADRAEQLEQALRDEGLDPDDARRFLEETEDLEETLRQMGADPEMSRQLADDIETLRERTETDEQVREDAGVIAETLDQAADELAAPPEAETDPGEDTPASPPDREPGAEPEPTDNGQSEPPSSPPPTEPTGSPEPDGTPPPDANDRDVPPTGESGEQQGERQEQQGEPEQQPQQQRRQERGQEQGEQTQEEQTQPSQQQERRPGEQQQTDSQREQQQQEQQQRQEQQQQDPQDQQQQQQQDPQDQQQKKPGSLPGRALREIAKRFQKAADKSQRARDLAEKARRMMENMDPEQQRKLAERAKQLFENMDEEQRQKLAEQAQRMLEQMTPEQREAAERMAEQVTPEQREAMQRMLEGVSPEQREQMQRMLEQMTPDQRRDLAGRLSGAREDEHRGTGAGREPGRKPGDMASRQRDPLGAETEDLDLGAEETADRIIARWLTPDAEPADPATGASAPAGRVRQAQEVAEQAVNDSALPRRYHRLIRRYFDRLPDTVEKAASPEPEPDPEG